jgi:hypothetical protein
MGLNDMTATGRYDQLFVYFLFTNMYLYVIAIYDDATAYHDGKEGLRPMMTRDDDDERRR